MTRPRLIVAAALAAALLAAGWWFGTADARAARAGVDATHAQCLAQVAIDPWTPAQAELLADRCDLQRDAALAQLGL